MAFALYYPTPHYTTLHYTTLYYTTLHYITLHHTTLTWRVHYEALNGVCTGSCARHFVQSTLGQNELCMCVCVSVCVLHVCLCTHRCVSMQYFLHTHKHTHTPVCCVEREHCRSPCHYSPGQALGRRQLTHTHRIEPIVCVCVCVCACV
jgi:hypothetical protein